MTTINLGDGNCAECRSGPVRVGFVFRRSQGRKEEAATILKFGVLTVLGDYFTRKEKMK